MLWEGCAKLAGAFQALAAGGDGTGSVISFVMGATDSFLFGMVLLIFAYAIAFGFVLDISAGDRERLPAWMRIASVGELKHTLVQVIVVYLVVDFATDIADGTGGGWQGLVKPLSIVLIAGAMGLLSLGHSQGS